MTKTDPATLPNFNGRPVPWVTRWTNEKSLEPPQLMPLPAQAAGQPMGMAFVYEDRNENRDNTGVLWQREGIARGGSPQWASVSTYRQRASMMKRLCQVCGTKIQDQPIRWLMPLDGLVTPHDIRDVRIAVPGRDDEIVTQQPPTCEGCIDLSLELCPHLKKYGYQILKVLDYEPWGVFGEAAIMLPQGLGRTQTYLGYEKDYGEGFHWTAVLAKQCVVRLGNFVVEELHQP